MPQSASIDDFDFEELHAAIIKHVNHNYIIRELDLENVICDTFECNIWDDEGKVYKVIAAAEGIKMLTKIISVGHHVGYKVEGFYSVNRSDRK